MKLSFWSGAFAGASILTLSAAHAATLIPVQPVSGSAADTTIAMGINDSDVVTGSWTDASNVTHGFVGTLAGSYTTFDYTDTANDITSTYPRNVNNDGTVVGLAGTSNSEFIEGYAFERRSDGSFVTIKDGTTPLDGIAQGLANSKNEALAGDHWESGTTLVRYGWTGANGKWKQNLPEISGSTRVAARGINVAGTVVGFFTTDFEATFHGFLFHNGTATQIDDPNPKAVTGTFLQGINDNGLVPGTWVDKNGNGHVFLLDTTTNTFTDLAMPGAECGQAFNGNNAGLIPVGFWSCSTGTGGGFFIYCPQPKAKCPSSTAAIEIPDASSVREPAGYFHPVIALRGGKIGQGPDAVRLAHLHIAP